MVYDWAYVSTKKKRKKEGKKERAQNDEVCGGHNQ